MGRLNFLKNRTFRIAAAAICALLLLLSLWLVFGRRTAGYSPSETEARLNLLLSEIEGVESATAMVCEEDGRAVSAVVLFEGKDGILTRSRILDVTSTLLRLDKGEIQVLPAQK